MLNYRIDQNYIIEIMENQIRKKNDHNKENTIILFFRTSLNRRLFGGYVGGSL